MKPILLEQSWVFVTVKYPYRTGRDLYVMAAGYPVFCAQCEAQFKVEELIDHIHSHDKRVGQAEIWTRDKDGQICVVVKIRPVEAKGGKVYG